MFVGNWDPDKADYVDTVRSCRGFVIYYAGFPITWKSLMQTEIALSTTKVEYIGISYALCFTIPIMSLLREMNKQGINVITDRVPVKCKVFEANAGAIEIARTKPALGQNTWTPSSITSVCTSPRVKLPSTK